MIVDGFFIAGAIVCALALILGVVAAVIRDHPDDYALLAVAAVARKLTVAVWYLMMGRWTPLEEIDERLSHKICKIITQVGPLALKKLNKTRKDLRQQIEQSLQTARVYVLDPARKFQPKAKPKIVRSTTLAQEYGIA